MVWRVRAGSRRTITPVRPAQTGSHDGLSYALWMPDTPPTGGVVVLHGAGSCKENHYDFARAASAVGLAALTFDQRGHGASAGALDGRAVDDVVAATELLRETLGERDAPVALRGSSMGGYLSLRAAAPARAAAVIAICPASADGLLRGLRDGVFAFEADERSLAALLDGGDLHQVVGSLEIPILLLHAQGDEQVPVQLSRELAAGLRSPASRLIEVPGGHHRSIQHDEQLQAVSLRFLSRELSPS
jgi:alpha-beta hydrolase superfamily lysophospholipase